MAHRQEIGMLQGKSESPVGLHSISCKGDKTNSLGWLLWERHDADKLPWMTQVHVHLWRARTEEELQTQLPETEKARNVPISSRTESSDTSKFPSSFHQGSLGHQNCVDKVVVLGFLSDSLPVEENGANNPVVITVSSTY